MTSAPRATRQDMPNAPPTALAVIPARLGSSRFPEKVLADRTGRPLVQHVVDRVRLASLVMEIVVATDSERVVASLRPFGTVCVMTRADHASGTDRVAEVAAGRPDAEIVVNIQGDEPEIDPEHVDTLIRLLATTSAPMATLVAAFPPDVDPSDPNRVKAVVTQYGPFPRALYFSRSLVPFDRDGSQDGAERYLHIGMYAYRRSFLELLTDLPPSPLELIEKLEQLRVLEYGHTIAVGVVSNSGRGIDTAEQYEEFVRQWRARELA